MPIPSRPIPTPAPRRAPTTAPASSSSTSTSDSASGKRGAIPGTSLPRPRCGLTYIDYTEGIYDLPLPSSAPVKGLSGVRVVSAKIESRVQEPKRMVVGVEGLVLDGLGKREKRSTTATSLGFDFIPNPSIVALPDHDPIPKSSLSMNNNSSFRSSHAHAHAQSPSTPALVPTTVNEQEVEDEDVDEDDDWEHISRAGEQERDQRRDDEGDEGDMIFLGELELEDRVVDTTKGKHVVVKGGKSYAAAAGSTVKA